MVPTPVVVIFASATILTVLGQIARPTEGYYIGNVGVGIDVIFPLSIVQCEPVLIYYNNPTTVQFFVDFYTHDNSRLLSLDFPPGAGYLDWICDIPAGYTFFASAVTSQTFTVQPGSSSACLGDITTTYSYAFYHTTYFQSYTQHLYSGLGPTFQL